MSRKLLFCLNELKAKKCTVQRRNISWAEVSRKTGIRHAQLLAYANNKYKHISVEHLSALCTYFGVSMNELMRFDNSYFSYESIMAAVDDTIPPLFTGGAL